MQLLEEGAADRLREDLHVDRAHRRTVGPARGCCEGAWCGVGAAAFRLADRQKLMAVALPSTLNVRLLIAVGDEEPIELGTLQAPGVKMRPLPGGEPGSLLVFKKRAWRRSLRRFFRAAARAI